MKLSRNLARLGAFALPILIASASLVQVSGQTPSTQVAPKPTAAPRAAKPKPPAGAWTHPKTAWGDPDLQGLWSYATLTPLERPASQAEREKLTPEEIEKLNSEHNDDGPLEGDQVGAYNKVWFDPAYADGRTSLIVDPPNGRRPPLTPEGQRRQAEQTAYRRAHQADTWEDLALAVRCIAYHGIPPMPTRYNNNYQIFQIPGYVVMYDEELTGARWIPLHGRPHLSKDVGLWNGDSRGRWEGNTLVVETTNFSPKAQYRIFSNPPTLKVVERFTRLADDRMENRFTIDDPTTYVRPFTAVLPMSTIEGPIFEYACHEDNDSLPAILEGERAKEKAAAEAKKTPPAGASQVR